MAQVTWINWCSVLSSIPDLPRDAQVGQGLWKEFDEGIFHGTVSFAHELEGGGGVFYRVVSENTVRTGTSPSLYVCPVITRAS